MIRKVFPNRNVALLFYGQLISHIGDSLYLIGLMWLVLELTGSKAAMGIVAMISYLPMLLFGMFAGILVDLVDRRRVMLASDLLRAITVGLLAVTLGLEATTLGVIFVVSFALSTFSTVFNPARDALLPELVAPEQLLRANALMQISHYAAMLLGPALGAALLGSLGLTHLFTFDALSFVASFFALTLLRTKVSARIQIGAEVLRGHFMEMVRYIHHDQRLRFMLGLTAINNFFIMGPALVGTPIFVKEVLQRGAASYALVESALGFGMLVGAFVTNLASRYMNKGRILLVGIIGDGLTYAAIYFCHSLEALMALVALHAVAIPMIVVPRTALVQEWVRPEHRGRVFSLLNVAVVGMTAISNAAAGWLAERMSSAALFGIFGVFATLCGVVGWSYSKLRNA